MPEQNMQYAVQMQGITKSFGSFYALQDMELNVRKGSIHSLLGENGAGKSTLMNILYGLYQPDSGKIIINGEKADIKNPTTAIEHGVGMVHQHFMLVEDFTVTQNIILGSEVTKKFGIVDTREARNKILGIVKKYGLDVDPDAKIRDISVGMQQRVEILKALYRGADLLILDEPTAVLTPQEIEDLIDIMNNLVKDGKAVIIITHKLKEIKASSDTCTVIRRGKYVDTLPVRDTTENELAKLMVGHDVKLVVDKTPAKPGDVVLKIENLVVKNERKLDSVKGLNLEVRKGEILGIAGIDGNGQKELIDAIDSLSPAESGHIFVNGKAIENTTPREVIDSGVSTIPEDRQKRGLILGFSVNENTILEQYRKEPFSKHGILDKKSQEEFAEKLIREYDVRPDNCGPGSAGELSGGNQQKIIIGREIDMDPDLLIAVQPTRGLDVGAIATVHKILVRERDKGKAVLLISFELDEIMNLSDTIAVIYDGKIQDVFKQGTVDENTLGLLMAGGKNHE